MPQYLVAIHHPDNFDPSTVTEETKMPSSKLAINSLVATSLSAPPALVWLWDSRLELPWRRLSKPRAQKLRRRSRIPYSLVDPELLAALKHPRTARCTRGFACPDLDYFRFARQSTK